MVRSRNSAFTLVELLVVIAIVGVLLALLLPAVQRARETSRRSSCLNNLRQIAMATIEYEGARRRMPGLYEELNGGKMTMDSVTFHTTWAVTILPGMERDKVYQVHAEGRLPKVFVPSYVCPSDSTVSNKGPQLSYVANAGRAGSAGSQKAANGAFVNRSWSPQLSVRDVDWTDGREYTLLYSENVDATSYDEIGWNIWGQPLTDFDDWAFDRDRTWGLGFYWWPDPPSIAWAPINLERKPRSEIRCAAVANYPHLFRWSENCSSDCCAEAGDEMQQLSRPSSMHGGGVNVAFASGRAIFLRDNIQNKVYIALMTLDEQRSDTPHRNMVLQDTMYQ
jgi:prepilin-type N-terminal cleavage/methylation domain-containing protein